jgi:hypothetical protein
MAGLHVHVGTAPECDIPENPLPMFQHLAYILVQYQEIISSFNSDQRRGYNNTHSSVYATSNLMGVQGHGHRCGQFSFPKLTDIQDKVFANRYEGARLVMLMGSKAASDNPIANRFKFVSW